MAARNWRCKHCGSSNQPTDSSCSNCGAAKPGIIGPKFMIIAGITAFLTLVIIVILIMMNYPERKMRETLSGLCTKKEILENGEISAEGQQTLAKLKGQWKISDEDAAAWTKEEINKCFPPPPLPDIVAFEPPSDNWTTSPQSLNIASKGASDIYYSLSETTDGSIPPEPPEPNEKNPFIKGSSGTIPLQAGDGEYKMVKIRFRGKNRSGFGPVSNSGLYSIDLRSAPPGEDNQTEGDLYKKLEADMHIHQGMKYAKDKDYDNAINEFSLAISKHPDEIAYLNRAVAYMQQRKHNKAIDDLKAAAEINPDEAVIHYNFAAVYSLQNQMDLALDSLDRALELGFSNYEALRKDPDLKRLRSHPEYRKTLEKHKVFIN